MRIVISNRSTIPIYAQIKQQIIDAILSDEIAEGSQLPSIRQLAKELRVSVITTTRAYKDLEEEGYIVNMQGKGCFVLPKSEELSRENSMAKLEALLYEVLELQQQMHLSDEAIREIMELLKREAENERRDTI